MRYLSRALHRGAVSLNTEARLSFSDIMVKSEIDAVVGNEQSPEVRKAASFVARRLPTSQSASAELVCCDWLNRLLVA